MLRKLSSLLFIILLYAGNVQAQQYNSILSQQGIGDLSDQSPVMGRAMGGSSFTINDENRFSMNNPATYSNLHYFSFESGVTATVYRVKLDSQQVQTASYQIPYIAIAFPIDTAKKWGMSIGALPFARQSYLLRSVTGNTDTLQSDHFSGNGQLTKFYIGSSIQLFHNFVIGANINYLFGNQTEFHALEFPNNPYFYSIEQTNSRIFGGLTYDAGFTYKFHFDSMARYGLQIGGVVNFPGSVNTTENFGAFTYGNGLVLADSIAGYTKQKGGTYMPIGYGLGIQLFKTDKIKLLADIYYRPWSQARMFGESMNLHDYLSVSAGAQIVPNSKGTSYFDKINYRFGAKYIQTYYIINNTNPKDIRFTVGAGFPIPNRMAGISSIPRNWSFVDVAFEFGQLGSLAANGMQQQYVMLSLGLHFFEPGWFARRRLD